MHEDSLKTVILSLACAVNRLSEGFESDENVSCRRLATLKDIQQIERNIMSAISEFAARQSAHNDRVDAAVTGLQGDIKALNDTIEKLQGTQGQITPEDQALLDLIEQRSDGIAARLSALDALTETVPTPPPA